MLHSLLALRMQKQGDLSEFKPLLIYPTSSRKKRKIKE